MLLQVFVWHAFLSAKNAYAIMFCSVAPTISSESWDIQAVETLQRESFTALCVTW